jgi:acetolactate synthase-1/2/3 large subunit
VLVDIPVDIMEEDIDFKYPEVVNIRGYKPTTKGTYRSDKENN